jgi:hypothetical protein
VEVVAKNAPPSSFAAVDALALFPFFRAVKPTLVKLMLIYISVSDCSARTICSIYTDGMQDICSMSKRDFVVFKICSGGGVLAARGAALRFLRWRSVGLEEGKSGTKYFYFCA